jgi:2',3'-cyclic-nucleotide 2'-phosphodiesterase (5'-nucleotidase family)
MIAVRTLALIAMVLVGCSRARVDHSVNEQRPLHLRVLATHDFHGALAPTTYAWSNRRPVGGMAALKAWMDSAEERCHCPALRLDAGDQMQGTLESNLAYGAAAVRGFNLLGLDAAAVGNHELDWGTDTLLVRQSEARYPWLAANVFLRGSNERPRWARPFAILEKSGLRVALVGYLTTGTVSRVRTSTLAPYDFRSGRAAIADALAAARRSRPDFTIILAHAGGGCDADGCTGEMVDLANELDSASVDLIIGGHDHRAGGGTVHGIPIVRAGSDGRAMSVIDLYRLPHGLRRFDLERDTLFADVVTPDSAMRRMLAPYLSRARFVGGRQVATLGDSLSTAQLGPLVAEAVRVAAAADAGVVNRFGIRTGLAVGTATYRDLFRVLPFNDAVMRVTLSGAQLRRVVERAMDDALYYFSGLRFTYDRESPHGSRVRSLTLGDGTAVTDGGSYTLAAPDFLVEGEFLGELNPRPPVVTFPLTLLDALIHRLEAMPQPIRLHPDSTLAPRT